MGALYLGIAGHWTIDPTVGDVWNQASDFGSDTDLNYAFMTQTVLKIRAARTYPGSGFPDEGAAGQLAWYSVGDPDPSTWRFGYNNQLSAPVVGASDIASDPVVQAWYTAAVAGVTADLADNPVEDNRIIQLDDETMHLWEWGRRGQAGTSHLKRETLALMQTHEDAFLPIKNGLVDALRTAFPTDEFFWYNIPFSKNKQPPYDADWWLDSDNPPDLAGQIDTLVEPLLSYADWVDGHLYLNATGVPPLQTRDRRMGWMRSQLIRKMGVASKLGKPFIARYFLFNSPTTVYANGDVEAQYLREFFQACKEQGVEHAAVEGGRPDFNNWASAVGMTPGAFWQEYVVAQAQSAGYLTTGTVLDPLPIPDPEPEPPASGSRPFPDGSCPRTPMTFVPCASPVPGGIIYPNQTDLVTRMMWIGVPSINGRQMPIGSNLYRFASLPPTTITGTLQTANPSAPTGTLQPADPGSTAPGSIQPFDPGTSPQGSFQPQTPTNPGSPIGGFTPADPSGGIGTLSPDVRVSPNGTYATTSFVGFGLTTGLSTNI